MKGIGYLLVSVLLFSVLDALVKAATVDYSIVQVIFFRSVFAFVPLSVAVWWSGGLHTLRTERPLYHVVRGVFGLVAMGAFFTALSRGALADVVAISFSGPLFIALLARPLLGERLGRRRWTAVLIGFVGVLLIVRPGSTVFSSASLPALIGALSYSFIMVLVRRMGTTESTVTMAVFFTMFTTTASSVALPWFWTMPDMYGFVLLAATGLAGGCANLCLTEAFRIAPVGLLAPFEYTALLWGILFGYVFWGEVPGPQVLAGAAVVVASGLVVVRRPTTMLRPRS
jgi:drug/metabolite transporter (DMT)-like permease